VAKRKIQTLRDAFSMLELVFVIVILGIVSSIGAEIIANVYEGYIVQRAQYRASMKVETTLTQIANRLTYAIPGTVIRRNGIAGTPELITTPFTSPTYTVLQWVAKDADSFNAISTTSRLPGWSGFCDLDASPGTTVSTPGSNLGLASTIIGNLGGSLGSSSIYFSGYTTAHAIASVAGSAITLTTAPATLIPPATKVEHYKLAWTSYALSVEDGDLYLYYNFAPSPATVIGGSKSLLLKNVTNFKFIGDGRTIRIKFCVREQIGDGYIPSCSERAIF